MKQWLEAWIGTPFRPNGQGKSGIDCVHFVASFYAELGMKMDHWPKPASRDYLLAKVHNGRDFHQWYKSNQGWFDERFTKAKTPTNGSLVVINTGRGYYHFGVFWDGFMYHVDGKFGVTKMQTPREAIIFAPK